MPLAGLPSLRAARAVEDEKLAVCEALENAGRRNPGGSVVERWVVADTRPPNMLRLEQCIVCVVWIAWCCRDCWGLSLTRRLNVSGVLRRHEIATLTLRHAESDEVICQMSTCIFSTRCSDDWLESHVHGVEAWKNVVFSMDNQSVDESNTCNQSVENQVDDDQRYHVHDVYQSIRDRMFSKADYWQRGVNINKQEKKLLSSLRA